MGSAAAANQYNGASFYQNLENKEAWGTAVVVSMGAVSVAYLGVAILGSTMYPGEPSDLIFKDFVAEGKGKGDGAWYTLGLLALCMITFSLLGSYPLISSAFRGSVLQLIELCSGKADRAKRGWMNTRVRRGVVVVGYMTVVILVTVFATIASETAAGSALNLSQLLVGNFLSFTFPGMMFYSAKKNKTMFQTIMVWTLIVAGPLFSLLGFIEMFMPKETTTAPAIAEQ